MSFIHIIEILYEDGKKDTFVFKNVSKDKFMQLVEERRSINDFYAHAKTSVEVTGDYPNIIAKFKSPTWDIKVVEMRLLSINTDHLKSI